MGGEFEFDMYCLHLGCILVCTAMYYCNRVVEIMDCVVMQAEELLQADAFNPLVDAVITAAQHHCGCRHGQLKLDGAFSTLYRGEVKGMADHIDYGSKNHVVPVSAILQCHTDAGFQGGGLWMRPAEKSSASDGTADSDEADGDEPPALRHADGRVLVELAPGDMLLLEGAWHQPREITGSTSERLVLVSFFKVVKPKPSGGLVQGEPEPQAESSGCFSAESPSQ